MWTWHPCGRTTPFPWCHLLEHRHTVNSPVNCPIRCCWTGSTAASSHLQTVHGPHTARHSRAKPCGPLWECAALLVTRAVLKFQKRTFTEDRSISYGGPDTDRSTNLLTRRSRFICPVCTAVSRIVSLLASCTQGNFIQLCFLLIMVYCIFLLVYYTVYIHPLMGGYKLFNIRVTVGHKQHLTTLSIIWEWTIYFPCCPEELKGFFFLKMLECWDWISHTTLFTLDHMWAVFWSIL